MTSGRTVNVSGPVAWNANSAGWLSPDGGPVSGGWGGVTGSLWRPIGWLLGAAGVGTRSWPGAAAALRGGAAEVADRGGVDAADPVGVSAIGYD
jgi:hypothetical protein